MGYDFLAKFSYVRVFMKNKKRTLFSILKEIIALKKRNKKTEKK